MIPKCLYSTISWLSYVFWTNLYKDMVLMIELLIEFRQIALEHLMLNLVMPTIVQQEVHRNVLQHTNE